MQDLISSLLGRFQYVPPIIVAGVLWHFRESLRTRHLVWLVVLTALGMIGLAIFALLGLAQAQLPGPLVLAGLYGSAALVVGCGVNVTLAFALLVFGHSKVQPPLRTRYQAQPLGDASPAGPPARAPRPSNGTAPGPKIGQPDFPDTVPQALAPGVTGGLAGARGPSEAERISASMQSSTRAGRWWSAVFLMIVLPALAAGILYSVQSDIARGYMRAATVPRSGSTGGGLISLQHDPTAFVFQAACLMFAAGLCLWFGYRAFAVVFGLHARPRDTGSGPNG